LGTTGPKLTEGLLSYLAGYFDGEGCVRFDNTPVCSVASIYPYTLEVFRDCFNGAIGSEVRHSTHKKIYRWRAYGDNATAFLSEIHPYLREKRVQALLCLEIRKTPPGSTRNGMIQQLNQTKHFEYDD
jgi:hypothetical protein